MPSRVSALFVFPLLAVVRGGGVYFTFRPRVEWVNEKLAMAHELLESSVKSTCHYILKPGQTCRRSVPSGSFYCHQHARGWRARFRALTRSQAIIFFLAVVGALGVLITIGFGVRNEILARRATAPLRSDAFTSTTPSPPTTLKYHSLTLTTPKDGWMPMWGVASPNIIWAQANGADLQDGKGKFVYVLIALLSDPTTDPKNDTRIEKKCHLRNSAGTNGFGTQG
jgi:hypothetical protein